MSCKDECIYLWIKYNEYIHSLLLYNYVTTTAPLGSPLSVSFTDIDPVGGYIGGVVTIVKTFNEACTLQYTLRWYEGSNNNINDIYIGHIDVTGSDLEYIIPNNTKILKPNILVYSRNSNGYSLGYQTIKIVDLNESDIIVPKYADLTLTEDEKDAFQGIILGYHLIKIIHEK